MTEPVTIPPVDKTLSPLALGSSLFGAGHYSGESRQALLDTMTAALGMGINHFDTASGYGAGESERLIGEFLKGRREQVFLASKAGVDEMDPQVILKQVEESLRRLGTEYIDLYYVHWPRQGKDLRPILQGLEIARQQGKIGAIGVSNFSVAQMQQISEAGQINVHQMNYSLLWRFAERDIMPYCHEQGIAVVTYASIAQGILTGKFALEHGLKSDDQRASTVLFESDVWPHIYKGVEKMKRIAQEGNYALTHLAIRWVLYQQAVHTAIVGARTPDQVRQNAAALEADIPESVFDQLTAISDEVVKHVPDAGNMYRYYP